MLSICFQLTLFSWEGIVFECSPVTPTAKGRIQLNSLLISMYITLFHFLIDIITQIIVFKMFFLVQFYAVF